MMQKLIEINDHLVRTLAECEQLRSDQKTFQEICSIRLQRINELQDELRKACAERDEAVEHAGRLQAERDELRKEQSKLQSICADGGRRITELKAELDATRKQLQDVCSAKPAKSAGHDEVYKAVRRLSRLQIDDELVKAWEECDRLQDELVAARKQLQDVLFEQEDISSVEPAGQSDLVRDVSHYIEAAEVDRPTTIHPPEYTPPEGWRVLRYGELLQPGDQWVNWEGTESRPDILHGDGATVSGGRYIRQIEPEPQFKPYTFAAYIVGDKSQPDALRIVWATEEWIQHSQFGIVHRMRDMHLFDNDGGCNITEYHETLTLSLKVQ